MDFFIYYGLTLIAFLITVLAQAFINIIYSKYAKIENNKNITGKNAARIILDKNGLNNIDVVKTNGVLSDHYDPKNKVIKLSSDVYSSASISAVAVAIHECGHAIQDKDNYSFLRLRSSLVPIVNFSSYGGYIAIVLGLLLGATKLIWLGIILEIVILLFQVITLPVEIDASSRALKEIKNSNLLDEYEHKGGKLVLTAAALTYVASVATALLQILRLILIYGNKNRD